MVAVCCVLRLANHITHERQVDISSTMWVMSCSIARVLHTNNNRQPVIVFFVQLVGQFIVV